ALPSANAVASIPDYRRTHIFRFQNGCSNDIKIAVLGVHSIISNGEQGWFTLGKGGTLDLTRPQATLFYYAETVGRDKRIWSGEDSIDFDGGTLPFKRVEDSSESGGDTGKGIVPYEIALSC